MTGKESRPRSFAFEDFNNDGQLDIAVANMGTNTLGIFQGYGNYSFKNQSVDSTGLSPWSIAVGDFNKDNISDIAVANRHSDSVSVFLGHNGGSFFNQEIYHIGIHSEPYMISVGDFNNDSILDIIVANYGKSDICMLFGHGDGSFTNVKSYPMGYGSHPFSISVGDFNSDKKLDFAVANEGSDSLKIYLQTC